MVRISLHSVLRNEAIHVDVAIVLELLQEFSP